jgi:16S rRNA (cytosine1402-N4)-methyltransferase
MAAEVAALLAPALERQDAVLVDATLGRAGHARALLDAHPGLALIGLLAGHAARIDLVHARYDELPEILAGRGRAHVQGILFDLGVSSPQLDDPARGFAYSKDAPLDMRMDASRELTAAEVVNTYSARQLTAILREFGEERFAARIAGALVRERAKAPLTTTGRLADIVRASIPAPARRTGGNPAKRTFQALRMEVNGELEALSRALPAAMQALAPGGRIVVLAYHSLEDRLVKHAFAEQATDSTPRGLPQPLPSHRPRFRLLTRGAVRPSAREVAANPRAASARLRAAERLGEAA